MLRLTVRYQVALLKLQAQQPAQISTQTIAMKEKLQEHKKFSSMTQSLQAQHQVTAQKKRQKTS